MKEEQERKRHRETKHQSQSVCSPSSLRSSFSLSSLVPVSDVCCHWILRKNQGRDKEKKDAEIYQRVRFPSSFKLFFFYLPHLFSCFSLTMPLDLKRKRRRRKRERERKTEKHKNLKSKCSFSLDIKIIFLLFPLLFLFLIYIANRFKEVIEEKREQKDGEK